MLLCSIFHIVLSKNLVLYSLSYKDCSIFWALTILVELSSFIWHKLYVLAHMWICKELGGVSKFLLYVGMNKIHKLWSLFLYKDKASNYFSTRSYIVTYQ